MYIYDLHYPNPTYDMFFLLLQTTDLIYRILEERFEGEDITLAQLRLLLVLSRHDAPLTSAELGRCAFRKSQTITTELNQLEKKGYVAIIGDQKDKRLVRIHITEMGEQLIKKYLQWLHQDMSEMVSCFSMDELKQSEEYLKRLRYWLFQLMGMKVIRPVPGFDGTHSFSRKLPVIRKNGTLLRQRPKANGQSGSCSCQLGKVEYRRKKQPVTQGET